MSRVFVSGQGAVSPAGWGVPALTASLENNVPLPVQSLARPGWNEPLVVRLVPPPVERPEFFGHPRLRRASALAQYCLGAALEALGQDIELVRSGNVRLGIVSCTMTGGISYSRRFCEEIWRDPATASPMIFPETVFNSIASHLAAYVGASGMNYTIIGDAGTFLQGLALGANWMENGEADACLVTGAEELDWTGADALRLFERNCVHTCGSGAIYLKNQFSGHAGVELAAVTDSFNATRRSSRHEAATKMRGQLPLPTTHELLCSNEPAGTTWKDWSGPVLTPKTILGEAFTASAAWQCIAACDAIRKRHFKGAHVSITGRGTQAIGARFATTGPSENPK